MPSWGELLSELQQHTDASGNTVPGLSFDELRTKYISAFSQMTGRNVIAYYSGWLKPGKTQNIDINDSDITGFMNAFKGFRFNTAHTRWQSNSYRRNCKIPS